MYQNILPSWGIFVNYGEGEYGGGVSFVDWDGDGWDDVSVCQNGNNPRFFKNNNGVLLEVESFFFNDEEIKQMCWVDFDNDGDKDLSVTSRLSSARIFRNDGGVLVEFTDESGILPSAYLTYGHSWGDYNNDGLLDLYICNYNYFDSVPNQCYHNNGDGTFTEVAESIGISDNANFSFQAVWLDYNEDGWQDLFVINDRTNSSNHLYRNDGGTFVNVTVETNLEEYIYSMSNTVGDYDNDGDFDIFVSNNPTGHLLHQQQDDGTFLEVGDAAGVATYDMGWASHWIDYDLDGWQDLHVNCSPFWGEAGQNKFYVNNQDGTFTYDVSMGFDNDFGWSQSSAVGDLNNDGVFDIMVVNDAPGQSKLWRSSTPTNNYLKVGVKGVISNRDGIGSKIVCSANGLHQMRYTYCGEGYLSQNSTREIFGLGELEMVDSLEITWLSGHVDKYYNIPVNQTITYVEGNSLSINLSDSNSPYICENDSILVSAPAGYASYEWSNGDTTQSTYSSSVENLHVTATTEFGIEAYSSIFTTILVAPLNVDLAMENVSCSGSADGYIEIDMSEFDNVTIEWSNDAQEALIDSLYVGQYTYQLTDSYGCITSGSVELTQPDPLVLNAESTDVSCFGLSDGAIAVNPSGAQGEFVVDWGGVDPQELPAGEYLVTIEDSLGCSLQQVITVNQPDEIVATLVVSDDTGLELGSATIEVEGGVEPYDIHWSNQDVGFNAYELPAGDYSVVVIDANGCELVIDFVVLNVSLSELDMHEVNLFPNPTANEVHITSKLPMVELRIYFNNGQFVTKKSINNSLKFDSSNHLESGNYIFEVLFIDGSLARTNVTIIAE